MNYILFDGPNRNNLLPFTFTRPVADIRIGILTIRDKWDKLLNTLTSTKTEDYLSDKYPIVESDINIYINGSILPTVKLVELIKGLDVNQRIKKGDIDIAYCSKKSDISADFSQYETIEFQSDFLQINNTWDIFTMNGEALEQDFHLLTQGRKSEPIPNSVNVIGDRIFIEPGAKVEYATLNASSGCIYLGRDSEIMEGSLIRGPFALCDRAVVKMGAKIYGPTTIGPNSKVGGEVTNSILFANSNKGHEGYLGNSVLGEWCNLGADTNTSNLKNNYTEVRLWDYKIESFAKTGLQFCGLMMGDHSKCGINTMFNTGTVIGVNANIFGSGYPRNFIPSFSWGGHSGFTTYKTTKAFEVAEAVMKRRNISFTSLDAAILNSVFDQTKKFRHD